MSNWSIDRNLSVSSILMVAAFAVTAFFHEAEQDQEIAILKTEIKHQDSAIVEVKADVSEIKRDVKSLLQRGAPSSGEVGR